MGCVFFFFRATSLGTVHMILCMCLYVVIAALYSLTVTGYIPTKKPLWILFAVALAYHIFVEDLPALIQGGLTVRDCLPEASVLSIMASLLCVASVSYTHLRIVRLKIESPIRFSRPPDGSHFAFRARMAVFSLLIRFPAAWEKSVENSFFNYSV